ncbi:hypothetical protein HPB48_006132 [Haemaphysalis longicornis]|uniref:Uncharacterized protein n=1 Tax=Haemaphysalis longicornis TaxID=44386 RepID=A0A9J6H0X5_HAELO|nr:hypothetical protein HPB48_006132 [Haemaphysalis longicornis]
METLMQEMSELRWEHATAEQPKQKEQPSSPANVPIANAPALKKVAIEPPQEGSPEGQVQADIRDIKSMLCNMQNPTEVLHAMVAELRNRTAYLEKRADDPEPACLCAKPTTTSEQQRGIERSPRASRQILTRVSMASANSGISIWQWNGREFAGKTAVLHQHIRNGARNANVVLLQKRSWPLPP